MIDDGYVFLKAENGVWLSGDINRRYVTLLK